MIDFGKLTLHQPQAGMKWLFNALVHGSMSESCHIMDLYKMHVFNNYSLHTIVFFEHLNI